MSIWSYYIPSVVVPSTNFPITPFCFIPCLNSMRLHRSYRHSSQFSSLINIDIRSKKFPKPAVLFQFSVCNFSFRDHTKVITVYCNYFNLLRALWFPLILFLFLRQTVCLAHFPCETLPLITRLWTNTSFNWNLYSYVLIKLFSSNILSSVDKFYLFI